LKADGHDLPNQLKPPPVNKLWVIVGINVPTEVTAYYKHAKDADGNDALVLDASADKYSRKKVSGINPRGLVITGGIGRETKHTYQPSARVNKSGDGTVPYCSLNYAESTWRPYAKQHNLNLEIQTFEVEGAAHRHLLAHPKAIGHVLDLLCKKG